MKKITIILSLNLLAVVSMAQDFHLSQYETAEMYLNPALAGQNLREGNDYRASSVLRSQWGSIASKNFNTTYLGYDQKFKERWGLGGNLINNQAGANGVRTFNFMVAGSYNVISGADDKHILTTGLQFGLMNKSIFTDDITFNEQYSETTGDFDQSLANNENFQTTSLYKFDAAWGIFYKYNPTDQDYHPYAGFAFSHISLPSQNFTDTRDVMPLHWKFNVGCDWKVSESVSVNPGLLYMYQKAATEIIFKTDGIYHLSNPDYDVRAKLGYRIKDAFIAGIGMRYKDFVGMMSYDYNTSYLNNYTRGNGGFEITISYQGAFGQPFNRPSY